MPIIGTRTGEPISIPVLTPEQKNAMWEYAIRKWAEAHPELFVNETTSAEST